MSAGLCEYVKKQEKCETTTLNNEERNQAFLSRRTTAKNEEEISVIKNSKNKKYIETLLVNIYKQI